MLPKVNKPVLLTLLVAILLMALTSTLFAAAGDTTVVSVNSTGELGNNRSLGSIISADGRFVAFHSLADNLVSGDTNLSYDVFVRDLNNGTTERVSVGSNGVQSDGVSMNPSISADGRYVAFHSSATNLVTGDTNRQNDIFVHDRETGVTSRASVSSSGIEANGPSGSLSISADGRFVAFGSSASNLTPDDTNNQPDIFVHDRFDGTTTRISLSSDGAAGNQSSSFPSISADGRYVAFQSAASNLVANDTNASRDIFVHDRNTGETERISLDSLGFEGNGDSLQPAISADGRHVAFISIANNLVTDDTNGMIDVFVHNRDTGSMTRVSLASDGAQANARSYEGVGVSAEGRFIAFSSSASNLVPGDTNNWADIFIHDRSDGTTSRVSLNSNGDQGNLFSFDASISADGRFVAFRSNASNFVSGDSNATSDIFVHERAVISNQPPEITELSPSSSDPISLDGQSVNLTVSFNDPDSGDSHEVDIDWGDGSVENLMDVTSPVTLSHTYTAAGIYGVKVTVTDSAGNSDSARYEYFVIYDPDGGFVTGHGKILSEPAWCHDSSLCGSIGGNAHFGFVSRYQRGAMTPSGRTTFVFRAGSFDFQSTAYRWLVVNRGGSNAQFRGEGLVNDALAKSGAYQFMIWAGDGTGPDGEDTFRIRIWYEEDGQEKVVYDNESGQPVANGKIKVQAN